MADDIDRNVNDYGLSQINSRKGLITELLGSKYSYRKWVKTNLFKRPQKNPWDLKVQISDHGEILYCSKIDPKTYC